MAFAALLEARSDVGLGGPFPDGPGRAAWLGGTGGFGGKSQGLS